MNGHRWAAVLLVAFAGVQVTALAQQDDIASFVRWAKAHAIPIAGLEAVRKNEDLKPLKSAIGNARVVALGENSHGTHEMLEFRNRLFEFLVQEMGFTAIALEIGFSESIPLDNFVSGGAGNSRELAQDQYDASRYVDETLELIEWMRAYNQRPSTRRKVRLYGIDMTGQFDGAFNSRAAIDEPLAYLDRADPVAARQLRRRCESLLGKFSDSGYMTLTAAERDALAGSIADIIALLERRQIEFLSVSQEVAYATAYHEAIVGREAESYFRSLPAESGDVSMTREAAMMRDAAMAQNLRWVLEQEGADGRVLLFAHRGHVQKSTPSGGDMPVKPFTPMGEYLHSALGDSMVVFGFTFRAAQGDFGPYAKFSAVDPQSLDGILSQLHLPAVALDLRTRSKPDNVDRMLNSTTKTRWNDGYQELKPAKAFDLLLFLDEVSPMHFTRR